LNSFNSSIHHHRPQRKDENAFGSGPVVSSTPTDDTARAAPEKRIGSDLTTADYAALEARWIDGALADRAGLRRVDSLTGGEIMGRKSGNYAGILIPYFRPGDGIVREYRLRRDQPDLEYDSVGNLKPRQKYLSPPGRSNMLYLGAGTDPALLDDMALPIVITDVDAAL
jgi:hypothetical protein